MATIINNINWYRGDSYPIEITILDRFSGLAINVTGCAFTLTVCSEKNPTNEDSKLFSVDGILDDPTTGKVSFTPTTTQTDLTPKTYYYDIEMRDPAGHVRTISKYKWIITQDITK